ncbi:hypothetical protein NDU88_000132 [Pleurodeles waltl]|uniref:C2H2-type domain-containing protein n=1 Tax=Pleurodeles waltl TaxID=8319 RepID=A0AAV7SVM9_PLEWA|nr:hypothetical protein NDU88_000132 [Pleurodeles waltl]
MKRLWLAARLRRAESGIIWKPCACDSVSSQGPSGVQGPSVRVQQDALPTNFPNRLQRRVEADGDVKPPVTLQEHQKDGHSHPIKTECETFISREEYVEKKVEKPESCTKGLEDNETPIIQSPKQEQISKRGSVPICAVNTQDQSPESGQSVTTRPNVMKQGAKKKSVKCISTEYGRSFCKPSALIKYQRTYIGDNSAAFIELGKYFKNFSSTDQKTHIDMKSSVCNENVLISPQVLEAHQQESTGKQEKLLPSASNETYVTKSVRLFPYDLFLQRHHKKHRKKQYTCTDCEKRFKDLSSLQRHGRKHTGKRYPCTECGKTYSRNSSLKRHKIVHAGNNPQRSTNCGTNVSSNSNIHEHQQTHDPGATNHHEKLSPTSESENRLTDQRIYTFNEKKPHACPVCGKGFSRALMLTNHHRIHTGEKPFSCSKCGRSFNQSSSLTRHQRIHVFNKETLTLREQEDNIELQNKESTNEGIPQKTTVSTNEVASTSKNISGLDTEATHVV